MIYLCYLLEGIHFIKADPIYFHNYKKRDDQILCPFCRKACKPLELPNNVYALQMLKQLKEKKMEKMTADLLYKRFTFYQHLHTFNNNNYFTGIALNVH